AGQGLRLAGLDGAAVQLLVAGRVQELPGVRRPGELPLGSVAVAELPLILAALVGDEDFLAAGFVADESDPLAVRRPARLSIAGPRRVRDPVDLAAVGADAEQLAVRGDDGPPAGG